MTRPPAVLAVLAAALCGCRTPDLPPVDLSGPGWQVRETDAVWRPGARAPEVAGELLLAVHPDGRRFVQFSKQGLPLVLARSGARGWRLESPLRPRAHGGRGRPTRRVPWFVLDDLPPTATPEDGPWRLERLPGGRWRLQHASTGEFLEGLDP